MKKHPNEFTRKLIVHHFAKRQMEVEVNAIENGYVIFLRRFSAIEGCNVKDPAGRLVYDHGRDFWRLYWMSGRTLWHLYDRYPHLLQALDEMLSEHAANLFQKVL